MSCSGRKKAALSYVLLYTTGCVTKHFNDFGVLLLGRLFCGIATSLLNSAFESWLVAEHTKVPDSVTIIPYMEDISICPSLAFSRILLDSAIMLGECYLLDRGNCQGWQLRIVRRQCNKNLQ